MWYCFTANFLWIFLSVSFHLQMHIKFFLADRCNNISYNERGSRKWRTGLIAFIRVISCIQLLHPQSSLYKSSRQWGKKVHVDTQCDVNAEKLASEAPRQKIVRVCNKAESTCAWGSMIANWSESDYQNVENDSKKNEKK